MAEKKIKQDLLKDKKGKDITVENTTQVGANVKKKLAPKSDGSLVRETSSQKNFRYGQIPETIGTYNLNSWKAKIENLDVSKIKGNYSKENEDDVIALQADLVKKGFLKNEKNATDGKFGDKTAKAYQAYQQSLDKQHISARAPFNGVRTTQEEEKISNEGFFDNIKHIGSNIGNSIMNVGRSIYDDNMKLSGISIAQKMLQANKDAKYRAANPNPGDYQGRDRGLENKISYTGVKSQKPSSLEEAKRISSRPSIVGSLLSKILPVQASTVATTALGGLPITQSNYNDEELKVIGERIKEALKNAKPGTNRLEIGYSTNNKGKRDINVGATKKGLFSKDPKVTTGLTLGKFSALKDPTNNVWYGVDAQDADQVSKKSIWEELKSGNMLGVAEHMIAGSGNSAPISIKIPTKYTSNKNGGQLIKRK